MLGFCFVFGGKNIQKKDSFNGLLYQFASLETFEPTTVLEDQHLVVVHLLAAFRNSCWPSPCSPVIRAPVDIQNAHSCDVSSTNLNKFLPELYCFLTHFVKKNSQALLLVVCMLRDITIKTQIFIHLSAISIAPTAATSVASIASVAHGLSINLPARLEYAGYSISNLFPFPWPVPASDHQDLWNDKHLHPILGETSRCKG